MAVLFVSCGFAFGQDLNDGLVAYYPFNGNANDESGNGNDGRDEWSGNIKGIGPFWGYKKDDVWYWGNGDVWKRAE